MRKMKKAIVSLGIISVMTVSSLFTSSAASNWVQNGNDWYYYDSTGTMAKNTWVRSNGGQFFMGPDGKMLRNQWISDNDLTHVRWYYVDDKGECVTGWQEIGGKWYFFYKDTFLMARNEAIDSYWLGSDGAYDPNHKWK
jgi:2',3'-cyclic-nucleotide 2'-phosphodiesterase/3'-nucleotidase/5'-nucleotidase